MPELEKGGQVRGDRERMAPEAQNAEEKRWLLFPLLISLLSLASQDENNKKPDIKLDVPEALKMFLIDDWESVTKNNQVCVCRVNTLLLPC